MCGFQVWDGWPYHISFDHGAHDVHFQVMTKRWLYGTLEKHWFYVTYSIMSHFGWLKCKISGCWITSIGGYITHSKYQQHPATSMLFLLPRFVFDVPPSGYQSLPSRHNCFVSRNAGATRSERNPSTVMRCPTVSNDFGDGPSNISGTKPIYGLTFFEQQERDFSTVIHTLWESIWAFFLWVKILEPTKWKQTNFLGSIGLPCRR